MDQEKLRFEDTPEVRRVQNKERFQKLVDRHGDAKPELKQLIDDFAVTLLEFSTLHEFPALFPSKNMAEAFMERYTRPLKPLEYFFTDTQLTNLFMQRSVNTFANMLPNKQDTLKRMQTDEFLAELRKDFPKEDEAQLELRRQSFIDYVTRHMDDGLRMRPIKKIQDVLASHPISGIAANGTLEEDAKALQGNLKPSEQLIMDSALRGDVDTPVFSDTEMLQEKMNEFLDSLKLALTPTPSASDQNIPYYEKLRLEGKAISPASYTLHRNRNRSNSPVATSTTPSRDSAPDGATTAHETGALADSAPGSPTALQRPNVYPFTAVNGHIGHGAFISEGQLADNVNTRATEINASTTLKPFVRQWSRLELSRLQTLRQYTTEWVVANELMKPPQGFQFQSSIRWREEKLSDEQTKRIIDSTPATPDTRPMQGAHETLRLLAQQLVSDVSNSNSATSLLDLANSSRIPQSKSALVESANDLLLRLSSEYRLAKPKRTHSRSPEAIRTLSAQLEEALKVAQPRPVAPRQYALSYPGQPRVSGAYQVEYDAFMGLDASDTATFKVRSPVRTIDSAEEQNAFHRLSWLALRAIANMDITKLAYTFSASGHSGLHLEDLWEAQELAQELIAQRAESDDSFAHDSLVSVASKLHVDVNHMNDFLFEHLLLAGKLSPSEEQAESSLAKSSSVSSSAYPNGSPEVGPTPESSQYETPEAAMERLKAADAKKAERLSNMVLNPNMTNLTHLLSASDHLPGPKMGDAANADYVVMKRKNKMDPKVRDLLESLTGAEIREVFPLESIYLHPFLTTHQRSSALAPIILSDTKLAQILKTTKTLDDFLGYRPDMNDASRTRLTDEAAAKLAELDTPTSPSTPASIKNNTARAHYILNNFSEAIAATLKDKPLVAKDGTLSDFGLRVERMAQLLELPPLGMSVTYEEFISAAKKVKADPKNLNDETQQKSLDALLEYAYSPEGRSYFGVGPTGVSAVGLAMLESHTTSTRMENYLAHGLPPNIKPGTLEARSLAADAAVYLAAKKAKESAAKAKAQDQEIEEHKVLLLDDLQPRFERLLQRGLIKPNAAFMIQPFASDSYDMLLVKQGMLLDLEKKLSEIRFDEEEATYLSLPDDVRPDSEIIIDRANGSREIKPYDGEKHALVKQKRMKLEELGVNLRPDPSLVRQHSDDQVQDKPSSQKSPFSHLFGQFDEAIAAAKSGDLNDQHNAALSEVNAISDMLGMPKIDPKRIDQVKALLSTLIAKVTSMDPLQMWELYPELAPPPPPQALHGPVRQIFDPLSIRPEAIPTRARFMRSSINESVLAWYKLRDPVTGETAIRQPMTPTDEIVANNILGNQHDVTSWLELYTFDLGFPDEKVKTFHEVARLSPRLFRKLDMHRDLEMMNALKETVKLAQELPTGAQKLAWFKDYQKQVARMAESIRSLIGPEGEAYLRYNDIVIKRYMERKERQLQGPKEMPTKNLPFEMDELDNPDERAMLQNIYNFINLARDPTELAQLEEVKDGAQYELWHIWSKKRQAKYAAKTLNKDLPADDTAEGQPDIFTDGDDIDDEEDANMVRMMRTQAQQKTEQEAEPQIPKADQNLTPTEFFARFAKAQKEQLAKQQQDDLDRAFWRAQDEKVAVARLHQMGLPTDPVERTKAILDAVIKESRSGLENPENIEFGASLDDKMPEHIKMDPIYQDMKRTSQNTNDEVKQEMKDAMKEAMKPLPEHQVKKHASAVAENDSQAQRIEHLLMTFPAAKNFPLDTLQYLADKAYAEQQEALRNIKPENSVTPETMTLGQAHRIVRFVGLNDPVTMPADLVMMEAKQYLSDMPYILQEAIDSEARGEPNLRDQMLRVQAEVIAGVAQPEPENLRQKYPHIDFGDSPQSPPSSASGSAHASEAETVEEFTSLATPADDALPQDHPTSTHNQSSSTSHTRQHHASSSSASSNAGFNILERLNRSLTAIRGSSATSHSETDASLPTDSSTPLKSMDPTQAEAWNVAYKLFVQVEVLDYLLSLPSTPSEMKPSSEPFRLPPMLTKANDQVQEFQNEFYRLVQSALFAAPDAFPNDVAPLKIIPWVKIQGLFGFSDRQLKTLMLFLSDKEHYMKNPRSRPPKMSGFFWHADEFSLIRNRFLGKKSHPSGEWTREELLHQLLFTDAVQVLQDNPPPPAQSPSATPANFPPLPEYQEVDRLTWAREEARLNPLPMTARFSVGQRSLVDAGLDPALLVPASLSGLERFIPVHGLPALGPDATTEQAIQRFDALLALVQPPEPAPTSNPLISLDSQNPITTVSIAQYSSDELRSKYGYLTETEIKENEAKEESVTTPGQAPETSATEASSSASDAKGGPSSESANTSTKQGDKSQESDKTDSAKSDDAATDAEAKTTPEEPKIDWEKIERDAIAEAEKEAEAFMKWKHDTNMIDDSDPYAFDWFNPRNNEMLNMAAEVMSGKSPDPNMMDPLTPYLQADPEHLVFLRRQYHLLLITKWSLLRKQMRLLEIDASLPSAVMAMNCLRAIWTNQTELSFWFAVPQNVSHSRALGMRSVELALYSEKMRRRLFVDLGPLIHGARHVVPRDSFGEVFEGFTLSELVGRKFPDNYTVQTAFGPMKPLVTNVSAVDMEEKTVWQKRSREYQAKKLERSLFNPRRMLIYSTLGFIVGAIAVASMVAAFFQQDEDDLVDRVGIEAQILKTRVVAGLDRVGYLGLKTLDAIAAIGRGIGWVFTPTIDAPRSQHLLTLGLGEHVEAEPSTLVPAFLVKPETGGVHYREFMKIKTQQEIDRRRQLVRRAYELYEARGRGDETVDRYIKENEAALDDAVRLAELRQYQKQKRDYAQAKVAEPELPRMPEWFEMPENRFWDPPSHLRFHPPVAEKWYRRTNWMYHPDDKAPENRVFTPFDHVFRPEVKWSKEGVLLDRGPNMWAPRPVDDLHKDDL